jgi:PP-loop superfamily ATP-utilizing enzyme
MIERQFVSPLRGANTGFDLTQPRQSYGLDACLLMFSGGRDSTLAAVRMTRRGSPLILVTVSSSHLVGIDRVRRRLGELARIIPIETPWLLARQPTELRTDTSFYEQTCLPCHHAYVVVSGALAKITGLRHLAFGYAGYQSDWPEQTPFAVGLKGVLAKHGIELELPVQDIGTREDAIRELAELGLTVDSLEQKCLRQVTNIRLDGELLRRQVHLWEEAIDRSMAQINAIKIEILDECLLGALA